jgi:hypothetical protein
MGTKQRPLIKAALENTSTPPTAFQLQLFATESINDWVMNTVTYYPLNDLGAVREQICCNECSDKTSDHCPCSVYFRETYYLTGQDAPGDIEELAKNNDKFHMF